MNFCLRCLYSFHYGSVADNLGCYWSRDMTDMRYVLRVHDLRYVPAVAPPFHFSSQVAESAKGDVRPGARMLIARTLMQLSSHFLLYQVAARRRHHQEMRG